MNKEYSVEELKLMLTKAEATIEKQAERIQMLEKYIKDSGLELPDDDEVKEIMKQL